MFRSQENLIFEHLYQEILEEGRKARYLELFKDPYFLNDDYQMDMAKSIIDYTLLYLKNPNAITWILKFYKNSQLKPKENPDPARIFMLTKSRIETLSHYENLGIRQIDTFNWPKNATYNEIIDHFDALEKKWLGDRKEWIDITDELKNGSIEKILDVGDNFAWYNLDRRYCNAEGDAMGHCGNSGSPRSNDTVLSLRKTQKRGNRVFARPSLTFIYDTVNHSLGEMKGRANEKPKPVYHPYILKLLMHKGDSNYMIKRVVGGGYKPENNFQLSDLSPALKKQLYDARPDLKSLKDIRADLNDDAAFFKVIESRLSSQFPHNNVQIVSPINVGGATNLHFHNIWADWDSLFRMINVPRKLDHYQEYVNGGDFLDFFNGDVDVDDMMRLFATAMDDDSMIENRVIDHIKETYDENFNILDHSHQEVFEILSNKQDDIIDTLRDAVVSGYDSGGYNQMLEYFKDGIADLDLNLEDDISVSIYFENPKQWMDSEIGAVMNLNYLLNNDGILATDVFERIDSVDGDMDVPYYGFDKYDRDAALDYFKSNLNI
jgi:hypothetical protein